MRMGLRGPKPAGGRPRNLYLRDETVDLMRSVGNGSASAGIEALARLAADDPDVRNRAKGIADTQKPPQHGQGGENS